MTVMTRPAVTSSGDLTQLLDRAERIATQAEREDHLGRLAVARTWITGRPVRIAVSQENGTWELTRALRGISSGWLPGASVVDVPGNPGPGNQVQTQAQTRRNEKRWETDSDSRRATSCQTG